MKNMLLSLSAALLLAAAPAAAATVVYDDVSTYATPASPSGNDIIANGGSYTGDIYGGLAAPLAMPRATV
ncbi:MAG: hypothetical protein PHI96_06635 [Desulfovibrio sp.]|nr:hypothetical protein [Desulfovibrio sp.]